MWNSDVRIPPLPPSSVDRLLAEQGAWTAQRSAEVRQFNDLSLKAISTIAVLWLSVVLEPREDTHGLADKPVSVTDLDLAVQPHRRHLLQPLEAEGVELEGGAAVFAVFKDGHSAVGGAADGRQRQESTHSSLSS